MDSQTNQHSSARLKSPQRIWLAAAWVIITLLAAGVLVASLPGYWRFITRPNDLPVLASPGIVLAMRSLSALISIAIAVFCLVFSAILFWRKSHENMAVFSAFYLLSYGILIAGPAEALVAFAPGKWSYLNLTLQYSVFTTATVVLLYLFPNGHFVPRWTRFATFASLVYIPAALYFSPGVLFSFGTPLLTLFGLGYILLVLTGVSAQVYRYVRVSTPLERQQTKWFVFGLVTWFFAFILVSIPYVILQRMPAGVPLPWWSLLSQLGWYLALAIMPLSLAVAVMRYRLWDVDILISNTLVYAALTIITVAIYILVVAGFSQLFESGHELFTSLLATGLVAVLFQPLRLRIQRAINRMIYGERDDPVAVLSSLGSRLDAVAAPEAALPAVVESVYQALKLPYVAISLWEKDGLALAASKGERPASEETLQTFELSHQNEPIGQLLVARRSGEESLTSAEVSLLQNIAYQAGMAAYVIQLHHALQHSRERLILAREEERRHLRRELHDGLGPSLASLTLKLDAARNLLKSSPEQAAELLLELKIQTQDAIADIRRLAYALRPPALDELGLISALQEFASSQLPAEVSVQFSMAGETPELPAAVEVAAYRIVCEALSNVARHAQAAHCSVQITFNHELCIDILDDGRGLVEGKRTGIGTHSMRERAAELGGSFLIEPASGGGTHVRAQLPL